jgi:UDP-N-acetyl-D-mannosaminuronic acid dehydrogenase
MVSERLIEKIRMKKTNIAVLGLGHVGLPTAAIFAEAGYSVIGSDVKKDIVNAISSLNLDTQEPRLEEIIRRVVKAGKLKAVADNVFATKQSDVMLICVQTPLTQSGEPDLRYLEKASDDVARGLTQGKLVVVVSTVPPGAIRNLVVEILQRESGLKCGNDFWLAYCPERMLPGKTIEEFRANVRLVGGFDARSAEIAVELFKNVTKGKILVTDIVNAEVAKLAENTFRYVNIAFANELALICEKLGADIVDVINLANTHPRVNIHRPGPGVGGPCLAKDSQLLLYPVKERCLQSKMIDYSRRLNEYMAEHVVKLVLKALKQADKAPEKAKIAVLGVAYKGEVSDPTNSPVEKIIHELMKFKVQVVVHDPYCKESFGAEKEGDLTKAVDRSDCMLVATDHKIFKEVKFEEIKELMNENPIVIDCKRIYNPKKVEKHGFIYYGIGYG